MTVLSNPAAEFCRVALMLALREGFDERVELAKATRSSDKVLTVLKAAVGAGGIGDASWAAELSPFETLSAGFIGSLGSRGAFDRMLPAMKKLVTRERIVAATTAFVGHTVAEGRAKLVSKLALSGQTLEWSKCATMVILSSELLEGMLQGGLQFLGDELRKGTISATDETFFAAVLAAVSPLGSSGDAAPAVLADIAAMLEAIDVGDDSELFLVVNPVVAKRVSTMPATDGRPAFPGMTFKGGVLAGIPTLTSDQIAEDEAVLLDASQFVANAGIMTLKSSEHATVEMLDASPVQDATAGTGASLVSLWQTGCRGLMAERFFAFEQAGANAAATMTDVTWGAP